MIDRARINVLAVVAKSRVENSFLSTPEHVIWTGPPPSNPHPIPLAPPQHHPSQTCYTHIASKENFVGSYTHLIKLLEFNVYWHSIIVFTINSLTTILRSCENELTRHQIPYHGFYSPLEHALLVSVVGCHLFHIFSTFTGLLLEFKHVITISHDPAL